MKHFFPILIFTFLVFFPINIKANQLVFELGTLFFGEEEKIVEIQDLPGTEYKLSYKYTYHNYLAGIYLTDDGYVIQKKGDNFNYLPLDKTKIDELQKSGELPNPLPNYSLPIKAYIFGYSLWWSILALVGIIYFSYRNSKKRV